VICYDLQAVRKPCDRCVTRVCDACDARVLPRVCITCRGPIALAAFNESAAMERIQLLYAVCIKKLVQPPEYIELMHDIEMYEQFAGSLIQIKRNLAAHINRSASAVIVSRLICAPTIMYLTLSLILSSISELNWSVMGLITVYIVTQFIRLSQFYFATVSYVSSALELTLWLTALVYVWNMWPTFGSVMVTISYIQHAASVVNFHANVLV
jgi:hypothetical protein